MTYLMSEEASLVRIRNDFWYEKIVGWAFQEDSRTYLFEYAENQAAIATASYFRRDDIPRTVAIPAEKLSLYHPWLPIVLDHVDGNRMLTLDQKLAQISLNAWARNASLGPLFFNKAISKWEQWYQISSVGADEVEIGRHFYEGFVGPLKTVILQRQLETKTLNQRLVHIEHLYPGFTKKYNAATALDLGEKELLKHCTPEEDKQNTTEDEVSVSLDFKI